MWSRPADELAAQSNAEGDSLLLRIWRFAGIYLTALTMSLTVAHLLEMPRKMQYGEALYMAVQHSLYLYFAWVGAIAEVGAVLVLCVLSVLTRKRGRGFRLTLLATLCVSAGLAVWILLVSPANTQMAGWQAVPLPENWTAVRRQWEIAHAVSAVLDLIGFGALILSVILETPADGHS
jgi:hypothetical protein